jgi:hypothetical protein
MSHVAGFLIASGRKIAEKFGGIELLAVRH